MLNAQGKKKYHYFKIRIEIGEAAFDGTLNYEHARKNGSIPMLNILAFFVRSPEVQSGGRKSET